MWEREPPAPCSALSAWLQGGGLASDPPRTTCAWGLVLCGRQGGLELEDLAEKGPAVLVRTCPTRPSQDGTAGSLRRCPFPLPVSQSPSEERTTD